MKKMVPCYAEGSSTISSCTHENSHDCSCLKTAKQLIVLSTKVGDPCFDRSQIKQTEKGVLDFQMSLIRHASVNFSPPSDSHTERMALLSIKHHT